MPQRAPDRPRPDPDPPTPSAIRTTAHTDPADAAAMTLCMRALPGREIASTTFALVGDIRAWRFGPGVQPAEDAFRTLPDDTAGAWCWATAGGARDQCFGVALPTREAVAFATVDRGRGAPTPSGAPALP